MHTLTTRKLAECPDTPNCVSTLATDAMHAIAPIAYEGDLNTVRQQFLKAMQAIPRATLVAQDDHYIHMEYRSFLFRFVDDVEVIFDDRRKTIHFRAAARLGHSDLGVNRRRMEKIRAEFKKLMAGQKQSMPAGRAIASTRA